MADRLAALVAHARTMPSDERSAAARRIRAASPLGSVVLETCHRVEVIGGAVEVDAVRALAPGAVRLDQAAAVRHLVRLAVGLESAVVGEDQVLHQLRAAARDARATAGLDPALDHLLDLALRAGRRARTWLPARRPTLADAALDLLASDGPADGPMLVVGAGSMGRLVVGAARRRGHDVLVASRSRGRAERVAEASGARAIAIDPGPEAISRAAAVLVALGGSWVLAPATERALAVASAPVVDLSSPPAIAPALRECLGARLHTIDDLATGSLAVDPALRERLERLVGQTVGEFEAWLAAAPDRSLARALVDRAADARSAELAALWRRMPDLDPAVRTEIERMAADLTGRLLRDPLERLGDDADGRHRRAARELFRL